jgi:hypothetical protein
VNHSHRQQRAVRLLTDVSILQPSRASKENGSAAAPLPLSSGPRRVPQPRLLHERCHRLLLRHRLHPAAPKRQSCGTGAAAICCRANAAASGPKRVLQPRPPHTAAATCSRDSAAIQRLQPHATVKAAAQELRLQPRGCGCNTEAVTAAQKPPAAPNACCRNSHRPLNALVLGAGDIVNAPMISPSKPRRLCLQTTRLHCQQLC